MVWFVQEEKGSWYVCAAVPDKTAGERIAAALTALGIHGVGVPQGSVPLVASVGVPIIGTSASVAPATAVVSEEVKYDVWQGGAVRFIVKHCPRAAEAKLEGLGFRRNEAGAYEYVVEAGGVDEVRRALWRLGRTVTWKAEPRESGL